MASQVVRELMVLVVTVAFVVPAFHYAFGAYARHLRPDWSPTLERRRLAILVLLVCAVTAVQIGEDVLDRDSHAIDRQILLSLRDYASPAVIRFMEAFTLTGSSKFLFPLALVATIALLFARRRFEALLLAGSTVVGALTIYVMKALVGRERPRLWETETYWGSSFPSGHTLAVAAFAVAATLCITRIRPRLELPAVIVAVSWIALVGLSRLVLGVHWPTDVVVAACVGAFIPLAASVAFELRGSGGPQKWPDLPA
jgi:undecaprenyl-diphosphatase